MCTASEVESETKTVSIWRVKPKSGGSWLIGRSLADLSETLEAEATWGDDAETEFILERTRMTEAELANLGDFDGW